MMICLTIPNHKNKNEMYSSHKKSGKTIDKNQFILHLIKPPLAFPCKILCAALTQSFMRKPFKIKPCVFNPNYADGIVGQQNFSIISSAYHVVAKLKPSHFKLGLSDALFTAMFLIAQNFKTFIGLCSFALLNLHSCGSFTKPASTGLLWI
jgi:hypothetical protein